MTDLEAASSEFSGKNVVISTIEGRVNGTLHDVLKDEEGSITHLVVRQYFHKTQVQAKDILMVRLA